MGLRLLAFAGEAYAVIGEAVFVVNAIGTIEQHTSAHFTLANTRSAIVVCRAALTLFDGCGAQVARTLIIIGASKTVTPFADVDGSANEA